MRSTWKSDVGLVRENNEDYVLADEENGIFLLADGMGGGPAGEVASRLAVITAHETLKARLSDCRPEEIPHILAEALGSAHSAIFKRTLAEPALSGMGTTLEIVLVRESKVSICHLGDSRIYLFHGRTLTKITVDDNYAGLLEESGEIFPEQIPPSFRHILTQAVGTSDELIPEIRAFGVEPGDLLLICSDGLTEALSDREIGEIISCNREDLSGIAAALVDAANNRGGPDNVSVVIIEPLPLPSVPKAGKPFLSLAHFVR